MLLTLEQANQRFDSIVSLGEVSQHPSIMKRLTGFSVEPFYPESVIALRRQDNPPAYFPFGVAYIAKTPVLLEENTFYTQRCAGFMVQRYQNYEIDDLFDFLCVERVMQHQWRLE
jgi:CMP-N,N'-diacetyllegionaminic acid synthase